MFSGVSLGSSALEILASLLGSSMFFSESADFSSSLESPFRIANISLAFFPSSFLGWIKAICSSSAVIASFPTVFPVM